MKFSSSSFADGASIPGEFAFCVQATEGHVAMSDNKNPQFSWSDLPEGTKSVALICHDPDVPSVGDDVNQEGRTVSKDLPRVDFYHWVLVDVDPSAGAITVGSDSNGITARGKKPGKTDLGVTGINDYTAWFKGDPNMEGDYGGYDGPCPPWNDEILHHYVFTLYALDVASLNLSGSFGGANALAAMEGHVLGKASWTGTYTLNPNL